MSGSEHKRRATLSTVVVGGMFVLCGVLGILQYRWIGEVSLAARERLQGTLQVSLSRLDQELDSEIMADCQALMPAQGRPGASYTEEELTAGFRRWRKSARHGQIFRRIAFIAPQKTTVSIRVLDQEKGTFEPSEWPAEWKAVRERLEFRLSEDPQQRRNPPGPLPEDAGLVIVAPFFRMPPGPGGPPGPFGGRDAQVLILELNVPYLSSAVLPELLQRHLGADQNSDYQVEVLSRSSPPSVIYQSDPGPAGQTAAKADASISLLQLPFDQMFRRDGPPGGRGRGRGPGRGPRDDPGRWQLYVRYRAGSLDAVVAQARWRNLGVAAGVLLLLVLSAAALIRFTRRAQKLAELQMGFVAGVSHELRTPLAVIHTAAYNLRGKMSGDPVQVQKYGALIQQESGRLTALVERVLQFAGAEAGRIIREPEPLRIEAVIEDALESSKGILDGRRCVVEKKIEPGLPLVMGDPVALKQALENLVGNAAKYGLKDSDWIGVFASKTGAGAAEKVEIRVADRGPGIPPDEQDRIFDAFFRGRRATQDQIHGTGLGLNLARKIVEAHGGTIAVHSGPGMGAEFVIRIPAAPAGASV